MASGPSLTKEDVEEVGRWRTGDRRVIAVNLTFEAAPWADYLYAMDSRWWRVYRERIKGFPGKRLAPRPWGMGLGIEAPAPGFCHFSNSGCGAIAAAIALGAERVYLLGYDCRHKRHWHADHPHPLSNCATIKKWPGFFERVAEHARDSCVVVLNCSRETALTCFTRAPLECVLSEVGRGLGTPCTFSQSPGIW